MIKKPVIPPQTDLEGRVDTPERLFNFDLNIRCSKGWFDEHIFSYGITVNEAYRAIEMALSSIATLADSGLYPGTWEQSKSYKCPLICSVNILRG